MDEKRSESPGRGAFAELKDAVTGLFEQVTGLRPDLGFLREFPRYETTVEDEGYSVRIELPGIERDAIDVSVTGRKLRVSGQRPEPDLASGGRWLRRERPGGRFDVSVAFAEEVDARGVSARLEDGVLHVRLPRLTDARGRSIEVETEEGAEERTGDAPAGAPGEPEGSEGADPAAGGDESRAGPQE